MHSFNTKFPIITQISNENLSFRLLNTKLKPQSQQHHPSSAYVNYLVDGLGQIVFVCVTIGGVVVQRFQQQSVPHHSLDRLAKSSVQSDSPERDKTKTVVVEQHRA